MTAAAQSQPPAPAVRFSVLIPVYDVRPFLDDSLGSVLAQTYGAWECLCVDDGSRDGSGARLDDYARKDPRIRVTHQRNGGVSRARNRALSRARGEFIVFLDSDDLWLTDCLLEEAARVGDEDCDVIIYDDEWFDERVGWRREALQTRGDEKDEWAISEYDLSHQLPLRLTTMTACGCFLRSRVAKQFRFDEAMVMSEDLWWVLQCLEMCEKAAHLHHKCYGYRQRQGSAVHSRIKPGHELDNAKYAQRALRFFGESAKTFEVRSLVGALDRLTKVFVFKHCSQPFPEAVWRDWFALLRQTALPKGMPWWRAFLFRFVAMMRSKRVAILCYAVPSFAKQRLIRWRQPR